MATKKQAASQPYKDKSTVNRQQQLSKRCCSTPSNLEISRYGADAYQSISKPNCLQSMYGSKTSQL